MVLGLWSEGIEDRRVKEGKAKDQSGRGTKVQRDNDQRLRILILIRFVPQGFFERL